MISETEMNIQTDPENEKPEIRNSFFQKQVTAEKK
jgi:hypothetical protein